MDPSKLTVSATGIPAAGKSVLASTLIHHLRQENVPILYFFFRHTIETNNNPEALLRDWLAQVLKYSPPLQHEFSARKSQDPLTQDLSLAELWRYLHRALMYSPKVYCVIDAIDEMNPERLEPLVRSLDALGRWRPAEIKLIVTSRPVAVVEKIFSRGVKTLDVRLDKKRLEGDIARYIQHRLSLSLVPPERHVGIKHAILQRADGLFLYAKLALDSLLQPGMNVPTNLAVIPADLTNMYTNLLQEHSRKVIGVPDGLQEFVLRLVTHATRALRLLEIADLVRLTQKQYDLGAIKDLIRSLCGPLLEILPDETVRVVHHSLTEYLTGMMSTSDADMRVFPVFGFGVTHHRLATACLSYLASGCLDSVNYRKRRQISGDVNYIAPASLEADQVLPPFTRYAASNWAVHVRRAISAGHVQTQVNEILNGLLVEPNLDKLDVLMDMQMDFRPTPLHFAIGLELQDYAKHLLFNKKSEYMKDGRLEGSLILYAATKGSEFMVKLLHDHGADLKSRNHRGRTPLHLAVTYEHTIVSAALIDSGIDPDVAGGDDSYFGMPGEGEIPWTPLEHVFTRGSFDMATVFYQRLHSPEAVTKALYHAISNQNTQAIELLLRHPKLDINAYYQKIPPIFAACLNRDVGTIELLLKSGAVVKPSLKSSGNLEPSRLRAVPAFEDAELDDLDFEMGICPTEVDAMNATRANAANEDRRSDVLHAWANPSRRLPEYKRPKLNDGEVVRGVRMLLTHGANVHQVNEKGETPLHLASDAATLCSLLEGGADPNAVNYSGETLLHVSSTKEILDVLLPNADLNLQTRYTKRTPLLYTLIEGWTQEAARVEKALRLIESGADVTAVDKYGNSALHLAVAMEDVAKVGIPLIEKLCSSGADVNLKNYRGKTPLHMNAPGSGRVSPIGYDSGCFNAQILHILLAAGADIHARDSCGETLLFQYVENGGSYPRDKQLPIFDAIVQAGAKIEIVDSKGRSLLHAQVLNFDCETSFLEHMMKKGVDPTHVDYEGNTLLHEAAPKLAKMVPRTQSPSLVEKLIEMGVDPRKSNHLGRTPLHLLTSINPGSFDPSLSYTSSSSGLRPSNADNPCGFDFYLHLCRDLVDRADKGGVGPLHFASTFSEYMTRRLLEEEASPSKATEEGLTPFHLAARSRQANIIGILLDKLQSTSTQEETIAVLNSKDILNRTALYYAAASGHVESFQLLLDAGATLDHDSYTGSSWNGCADFEQELGNWSHQAPPDDRILKRKKYNHTNVNAGGVMISHTARSQPPEGGYLKHDLFPTERLDEILDILAYSMSQDQIGFVDQAIASATEKTYDYTVESLLRARDRLAGDAKDDLDEKTQACLNRRQENRSALGSAGDRSAIIRLMKSRDYRVVSDKLTPVNCLEWTGRGPASPLASQFVSGGFTTLVSKAAFEKVISKSEWREKQDQKAERCESYVQPLLISACSREMPNMDVIRTLVEDKKVNVNARMPGSRYPGDELPKDSTALHCLAEGGHWWQTAQAIPYLVHHGADLDAVEKENGLTPLGYALRRVNGPHFTKRTVKALLDLGASPNGVDCGGNSYLSWTVKCPEMFQLLVQHGAAVTRSAVVAAIYQQDVDLVQMLLSNGADPNERKAGEERPEIWHSENSFSLRRSDPSSQDELYLIDWIAGELYRRDDKDRKADDQIFKMLLEHGADPSAPYLRTTVMHRIMENRGLNSSTSGQNRQLGVLLDQPGVDFNTRDADGMTLLLLAAKRGFGVSDESTIKVIQKLLDRGADIYARDRKGRSAMHHASCFKKRCDFILSKAPELMDSPDNEGKTPLHHALAPRNGRVTNAKDATRALITAGADVTHPDHEGKTPLHLALDHSEWMIHAADSVGGSGRDMFDRLVAKGADVNARTHAGEPPIFGYVRNSHIRAETDVSQLGPCPKEECTGVRTDWDMAKQRLERAAAVQKEGILWTFFEQQGVDLRGVNEAGEGLLHLIAQDTDSQQTDECRGRRVAQFKFLVEKGFDPAIENKEHQTPLDLAAALRKEDLLALFKRDE